MALQSRPLASRACQSMTFSIIVSLKSTTSGVFTAEGQTLLVRGLRSLETPAW
jgi:hypothetical protein